MSQPTVYRAIPHNSWQLKWGKVLQQTEPNYTLDRCQWTAAVQESCSKTWDFHRWYICIVTTLTEFKLTVFLFFLFSVVCQQGWSCSLCTTTRRSERARWSTTLSRCRCGFRTATRGSRAWRPTGWITWPSTSTTEPRWSTDTSTSGTSTVSWHAEERDVSWGVKLIRKQKYFKMNQHRLILSPSVFNKPSPLVSVSRIVPLRVLSELTLSQLLKLLNVPKLHFYPLTVWPLKMSTSSRSQPPSCRPL